MIKKHFDANVPLEGLFVVVTLESEYIPHIGGYMEKWVRHETMRGSLEDVTVAARHLHKHKGSKLKVLPLMAVDASPAAVSAFNDDVSELQRLKIRVSEIEAFL